MAYNREDDLKQRFNNFITKKITDKDEDYYSKLSIEVFEEMKTTLKDINNIITYKTTLQFMEWARAKFTYINENYDLILSQITSTKPNDNGYDVIVSGDVNLIAEVKCNRPINNGYKFGSAQRNGLIKDIYGLIEGKTKAKSIEYADAIKFLVIYDFGDYTTKATENLIKNLPNDLKGKVEIYQQNTGSFSKEKVYVLFIK